jgi:hypothetical protein
MQAQPEVVAQVEWITPQRAEQLLQRNSNNRSVRARNVAKLAKDMKNGSFPFTGETVKISPEGKVLDGQHRLLACVQAGVSFHTLVAYNVPEDAMPMIDKGVSRRFDDTLGWKGVPNRRDAAAVTRRMALLVDGITLRDTNTLALYTDQQLVDVYDSLADQIQVAVQRGGTVSNAIGRSTTGWAVPLCWLALNSDDDSVAEFTDLLVSGASLSEGSPILALRNWTTRGLAQRKTLRPDEMLIGVVKSYNAWLSGHELKLIRVNPTETVPEVVR